jgi:anti-anti-sigma regulatory factor/HAMP domain-containing protein
MTDHVLAVPITTVAQRSTNLRRQLLLVFCLMLATVLISIGAVIILFVQRNEEQTWRERQTERARSAEAIIGGLLEQTRTILAFMGTLPADTLIASPELLQEILVNNPELSEIIRLDEGGKLVSSAAQSDPVLANLFTVAQSVWFREALAGNFYLSDVQLSAQNEPYLIVAAPAVEGGVVAARLRLTVLEALVGTVGYGGSGQTYVVNRVGQMIAHPDRAVVLANTSLRGRPELEMATVIDDTVTVRRYINFQGTPVLGVTTALPAVDWLLVNEVNEATATALSRTALIVFGVGMLLFGLFVLGVSTFGLERLILRPIEQLRTGAVQIARGDSNYRLSISRRDEIGEVAAAFNQMAQSVQQREQDLARLAASLEETVHNRTAELRREVEERSRLQDETEHQAQLLRGMSTPVIPIDANTLVMPLVGSLDSNRIVQIQGTLLQALERSTARVAILDVTGVPVLDSQMAAALIATSQAARLLGAATVLTGIRPELAQTLVALGIDLSTLRTRSTLQSGIEYALRRS